MCEAELQLANDVRRALQEMEAAEQKERDWNDGCVKAKANLAFNRLQRRKAGTAKRHAAYRVGVLLRGGVDV